MWNAERTVYCGETLPDVFERALLGAYAKLHWLKITTAQHIRDIALKDKSNAL